MRTNIVRVSLVVVICALLAGSAWAQQASAIAGVVKDTTGAVMPGVTVEAASPALIEKVRSVVSDTEGRYNIVELRPGTYTVTFSLTGFRTVRREGIELTAGFTATVNADLQVGALEETITVSGSSPLVDTQDVKQQAVISTELLSTLPSGAKSFTGMARLVPGMTGGTDSGGASGLYSANSVYTATVHGKAGAKLSYDGMETNNFGSNGALSYIMNPSTVVETVVEAGGISAESDVSGVTMNMIPKEGGNVFKFSVDSTYTNQDLQGSNLSDTQRALGNTTPSKVLRLYDANVTGGGPVIKDRLWFLSATRFSGTKNNVPGIYFNATQGTPFYTADLTQPAYRKEWLKSLGGRLTWQLGQKNKLSAFADTQSYQVRGFPGQNVAPEAQTAYTFWPDGLYQITWSSAATNKLLFEAGASLTKNQFLITPEVTTDIFGFTVKPTDISITEASTNFAYNARPYYRYINLQDRYAERFSVSYVTGSHAFKTGFQLEEHVLNQDTTLNGSQAWTFLRGAPNSITEWADPQLIQVRTKAQLGFFAQDKWAIKRLTLNYGLRLEYFNAYAVATDLPAGPFVGARSYPQKNCLPCWTDLDPRVGVSYDLFGDGKTALKTSLGRYVAKTATDVAVITSPITTSVNTVTRSWTDANGNYVPDCDLANPTANGECGPLSNVNFGKNNPSATLYDHNLLNGFDVRDYFWDSTTEVQQQLGSHASVTVGYDHNWSSIFGGTTSTAGASGSLASAVTHNTLLTPANFSPYCVTAPVDPRLPGGGGYQVCGLYDVAPALFGQGQLEVSSPSQYSNVHGGTGRSLASDFFTAKFNTRLGKGIEFGGALDTGRSVIDSCFVADNPQNLLNCRVVTPFKAQTQIKLYGSYPLPAGFVMSGVLQNLSGVNVEANYTVPNAQVAPSLGRNLAACGTRPVCTASVTVPLYAPMTQFEPRQTILDLRVSKLFSVGSRMRLRANFDIYNLLNDSSTLTVNNTYGPTWQKGLALLNARLIQFGGQLTF